MKQFVNLAGSLHFGRAAEASNVSPSALSRGIQRLEGELDVALFERNNRNVSLTHAGKVFLEYARGAVGDWDAVRNRLMAETGELHGEVSLYCSVTASYSFLFDILARVRRRHPRIEIKLHTGDPEDAIGRVLAGAEDPEQAEAQVEELEGGYLAHAFSSCEAPLSKTPFVVELADKWIKSKDTTRRSCGYGLPNS